MVNIILLFADILNVESYSFDRLPWIEEVYICVGQLEPPPYNGHQGDQLTLLARQELLLLMLRILLLQIYLIILHRVSQ